MDPTTEPAARGLATLRVAAWVLAATMTATVGLGLATAPTGAVAELGANVWGRVTIVDLYLTFGAVCAWIVWREPSRGRGAAWTLLVVTTGSAGVWVYVALAATGARDVAGLLLGRHADPPHP